MTTDRRHRARVVSPALCYRWSRLLPWGALLGSRRHIALLSLIDITGIWATFPLREFLADGREQSVPSIPSLILLSSIMEVIAVCLAVNNIVSDCCFREASDCS